MPDTTAISATALDASSVADAAEPHLVLWNTATFYGLRPEVADRRVRIDHHDDQGRLVGSFVGGRSDGAVVSGYGAPFGGLDLAKAGETVGHIEGLVDAALTGLAQQGVAEIEVRAKPAHYGQNEALVQFAMLNRGFTAAACELNAYLDLTAMGSVDDYVAGLKPAARKMLRRSEALGLHAFQVAADDEDRWAEAYEVLRRNRVDRGRPMRLSLDYVCAIRDAFPGRVRLVALAEDRGLCAAALVYRVAAGRDVVQYWGDALHELPTSPMNLLVKLLVEHALAAGTQTIDIGVSSDAGLANQGLVQFKRSVGCTLETRLELVLTGWTGRAGPDAPAA